MVNFTCITCHVLFQNADFQRDHYKTDWHRYNLKRKIVELQPVTEDDFDKKVAFQTKKKDEKLSGGTATECQACNKKFSSEKACDNHVKSKKHREQESKQAKNGSQEIKDDKKSKKDERKPCVKPKRGYMPPMEDTDDVIDDDSDEWEDVEDDVISGSDVETDDEESEAIPQSNCLFCPHESISVEDNMRHMSKSHSFFIPDLNFITDLEGFLIYLGAKVGDGKICLLCNNRSRQFRTIQACQEHMIDKGHCMLDYQGDAMLEYADFYDFSSSYPDHNENMDVDRELSTNDGSMTVDPHTLELVLPNGVRVGHRALRRYYNQNTVAEMFQTKNRAMITGVNTRYKALGLSGATLTVAIRKKIVARKFENRHRADQRMRIGMKGNSVLQTHFRKQVMNCG